MKISAPLLADRLALYATDAELRAAIFGARAKDPREGKQRKKNFWPGGSGQPIEKAHFGQGNPRKSKHFPWKNLAGAWIGLARL